MPAARPKKHGFAYDFNYQQDFHPKLATTPPINAPGPQPSKFIKGGLCYWKLALFCCKLAFAYWSRKLLILLLLLLVLLLE